MRVLLLLLAALVPPVVQDDAEPLAGWLCRLGSEESGGPAFRSASAAFWLEQGESLHPLVPPTTPVTFDAVVEIDTAGDYQFALACWRGQARLEVWPDEGGPRTLVVDSPGDGETELISLELGEVRVRVHYQPRTEAEQIDAGGDAPSRARLLVSWRLEPSRLGGFEWEPLSSRWTSVPADAHAVAVAGERASRGRMLLERHGCTNCHLMPEGGQYVAGRRTAPDLGRVGARADLTWLTSWIADPRAHGAIGMPDLVGTSAADPEREARALAHFVASVGLEPADADLTTGWAAATEPQVVARGRELYHTVGCIACHGALESPAAVFEDEYLPDAVPASSLVPLDGRANKWRASALAEFLLDPSATRSDASMPSLGLSEEEADLLATYLIGQLGAGEHRAFDPAQAEHGSVLFEARGCSSCHDLPGPRPMHPLAGAPALDGLDPARGCLDLETGAGPRYALSPGDRAALVAALEELTAAGQAGFWPAPLDQARRGMQSLRCTACHEQDGAGGPPEDLDLYFRATDERVDLGDEGRLPPDLTGVGTKLQHQWLAQVVSEGAQARPYLGVRMPHFGAVGTEIAAGLASAEAAPPDHDRQAPVPTDASIRTGRELLGPENFACMTCHVYGDFPATGSPGPSITQFAERLRYEWFSSYMHNPQRYKPGGRMPDFSIGGRSSLTAVLDGDLTRQIDAMWSYFELGEFMPAPDGVEPDGGFALPVGDRPVVHRGFLIDVGSRGIAVGLPVGVHFAFDAATCRLVHAWKGPFIDAAGSWAGRGGSELGGRGPIVWTAPEGPALQLVDGYMTPLDVEPVFRGYRLDAEGWPTFLWSMGDVNIAESFDAALAPELVITRRFEFEGLHGHFVELATDDAFTNAFSGLRVEGGLRGAPVDKHAIFYDETEAGRPVLELELRP